MEGKSTYWKGSPPTRCDMCKTPLQNAFIDGNTPGGPWAMMCPRCHNWYGLGLGTGRGQRYELQTDGRWIKTGG